MQGPRDVRGRAGSSCARSAVAGWPRTLLGAGWRTAASLQRSRNFSKVSRCRTIRVSNFCSFAIEPSVGPPRHPLPFGTELQPVLSRPCSRDLHRSASSEERRPKERMARQRRPQGPNAKMICRRAYSISASGWNREISWCSCCGLPVCEASCTHLPAQ